MSNPVYFMQECPTCGRQLRIRVSYLGKHVVCQHCKAAFEAADPDNPAQMVDSSTELLKRAEELLESASNMHGIPR